LIYKADIFYSPADIYEHWSSGLLSGIIALKELFWGWIYSPKLRGCCCWCMRWTLCLAPSREGLRTWWKAWFHFVNPTVV